MPLLSPTAGGAGTWSDGKLTTRIGRNSDPVRRVLQALHAFGAPDSVLVSGKPHLGTDRLVHILRGFRQRLIELGVSVRFGTTVEDIEVSDGAVTGVRLAASGASGSRGGSGSGSGGSGGGGGEVIKASAVVLAVGHSARAMYARLAERGIAMAAKPFAMGFRIEHPQALIDSIQYGTDDAGKAAPLCRCFVHFSVLRWHAALHCGLSDDVGVYMYILDVSTAVPTPHAPLSCGGLRVRTLFPHHLRLLPPAKLHLLQHRRALLAKYTPTTNAAVLVAGLVLRGKGHIPVAEYSLAYTAPATSPNGAAGASAAAAAAAAAAALTRNPSPSNGKPDCAPGAAFPGDEGGGKGAGEGGASGRGVYSFCMCPGGQIVPTSTTPEVGSVSGHVALL